MPTHTSPGSQPRPAAATPPQTRPRRPDFAPWRRLARDGWVIVAGLALVILILSLPGYLVRQPLGGLSSHLVYQPTPLLVAVNAANQIVSFAVALLCLSLAALLYRKRPHDRMALFLAYYLLAHGVLLAGPIEMLEYLWPGVAALNSFLVLPIVFVPLAVTFLALFPDGHFTPAWTRWAVIAAIPLVLLGYPVTTATMSAGEAPRGSPLLWLGYGAWFSLGLVMLYTQVKRYRHVSTPVQRQQTKWVLFGFTLMIALVAVSTVPWRIALALPAGTALPWWAPFNEMLWAVAVAILPVTLAVAVMRYRLYDIDLIVNRTLVYGALTVSTMGFYVFAVGFVGNLIQAGDRTLIAFLTTGLVAVLFQPLRLRLQRAVNHLMYGERDEPFEVLARLGRRLEETLSPHMVYPTIVETVAQTLKLPHVAIAVKQGDRFEVVESRGNPGDIAISYPLSHQGEVVGQLVVAQRAPDEALSAEDARLLRNLARQAGAAVHAVQLTADLQRARQQLVTSREEERRRLRRDLHDGLGPALAALHLQAGALRRLIHRDPEGAEAMVDEFRREIRAAIDDIRRVVYQLRPPVLDQLGLVAAVRAQAARYYRPAAAGKPGLQVRVYAEETWERLPAAVEVAAFFIIQEALANVVHHAQARHCLVRLHFEDGLRIEVSDDGVGLAARTHSGVGLQSMHERAAELGGLCTIAALPAGGTQVRVWLPLPQE